MSKNEFTQKSVKTLCILTKVKIPAKINITKKVINK
ncbi:hypothetical protein ELUCI_v1c04660 [Williamsoniiplasma lucivorax]|uniref:Uncharacterized protein n=1 Tax=Williamsoniiplasma lucivorax TaxID=209274 RepID=A0A2S5RGB8_9MOLU|nr:hypothetical protein ELUCI_v1c04660 [Williamsoniiplasma lucivorax]